MHLLPLPALADNYIWLLHDDEGHALVVDPGDDAPVEQALAARELRLQAILLTHHHHDHVGGALALRERHGAAVYAPEDARIAAATVRVRDGERIDLPLPQASFEVIAVPGHTLSHVAYFGEGVLLAGDTLFSMGCGRLFEGTPAQMLASLDRLAALPADTLLCCGHEYTAANGRFAREVEPDNAELSVRVEEVAALRASERPSLPVSMASERATNPFLRTDAPAVVEWCRQQPGHPADRTARFAAVRSAKDAFRA
ncbi:hydroxyacylglutathione hydrolase [Rhodanobacter sp. PCA2]|uniref:hydroxyacylglutathione hydrolase n=1 Tax=Rhodanobacter sp. PCA2 TaxID=2006117 RepID=UPI0015E6A7E5|nr:hydroxyacylglutathione hydrolase [Rhodanobacter sp. PCA2]MBA2078237.1 hydroxyacylglutathione hydrolase [Rhodanobacter sp. PCA2]